MFFLRKSIPAGETTLVAIRTTGTYPSCSKFWFYFEGYDFEIIIDI